MAPWIPFSDSDPTWNREVAKAGSIQNINISSVTFWKHCSTMLLPFFGLLYVAIFYVSVAACCCPCRCQLLVSAQWWLKRPPANLQTKQWTITYLASTVMAVMAFSQTSFSCKPHQWKVSSHLKSFTLVYTC